MLRYEDVCRAPRAALSQLLGMAGLSLDEPAMPDLHAIGGSPDSRSAPLDELQVDDRWKDQMPAATLARFERRAGALNRRIGAAA